MHIVVGFLLGIMAVKMGSAPTSEAWFLLIIPAGFFLTFQAYLDKDKTP